MSGRAFAVAVSLVALAPFCATTNEPVALRFVFGGDTAARGTRVTPETLFAAERGFEFEPGAALTTRRSPINRENPV